MLYVFANVTAFAYIFNFAALSLDLYRMLSYFEPFPLVLIRWYMMFQTVAILFQSVVTKRKKVYITCTIFCNFTDFYYLYYFTACN